mgnify:CR=1 FL=1
MRLSPILVQATTGAFCVGLAACAQTGGDGAKPIYRGVETRLLDGDLVNFHASLTGTGEAQADEAAATEYSVCAAAQYAVIRGYGFARHVRTTVARIGEIWRGDAVYTISAALPRGLKTIDAEVTVRDCGAQGIPTV